MKPLETARTRPLVIIAQDPSVKRGRKILRAVVDVPAESLAAGPWGHRIQIIDYDTTNGTLYRPLSPLKHTLRDGTHVDPYVRATDRQLLNDPNFHAQNVYAIAMRALARFEFALGRRVSWGFGGHQLKVAPHAFADANAFYTSEDEALVFGYFPDQNGRPVFACLSHDVVAHETTHALVDGLRHRFMDPSSPDQAAFHEGFADVVALLSVYSLPAIVSTLIDLAPDAPPPRRGKRRAKAAAKDACVVSREAVTPEALRNSILFGLAEQMGQALSGVRGQPLRQSAKLKPVPAYYSDAATYPEFLEPHRRGEILVAAMMNAFLTVWSARLARLGDVVPGYLDRQHVVEEGANAADYLLTMAIRSLDYTPPVQLQFGDFVSALVTADVEMRPNDSLYEFRRHLLESFAAYGILPASEGTDDHPGVWRRPLAARLVYGRTHFESMTRDPDEVFWFIWENRKELKVFEGAYGRVLSVRPCLRVAPDGFPLRETVVEFYQVLKVTAAELQPLVGIRPPKGMPDQTIVSLYGGNALIFNEYGRLKFNVHNSITDVHHQQTRLQYLWDYGFFSPGTKPLRRFAEMHLRRAMNVSIPRNTGEEW